VFALAAGFSFAAPWLSQLEIENAAHIWTKAPRAAYSRLEDAARLNPLSAEADLVAGTIALRYGDLKRADHEFSLALGRSPDDSYATLERGAIASSTGQQGEALRLLARAAHLNPRDPVTEEALRLARRGRRIDIRELSRSILYKGQQLT
jgi:Flp pilus assembly protein TadD